MTSKNKMSLLRQGLRTCETNNKGGVGELGVLGLGANKAVLEMGDRKSVV